MKLTLEIKIKGTCTKSKIYTRLQEWDMQLIGSLNESYSETCQLRMIWRQTKNAERYIRNLNSTCSESHRTASIKTIKRKCKGGYKTGRDLQDKL